MDINKKILQSNINVLIAVSSRGVKRRGDLVFPKEMTTLPSVARHDNVTKFITFILVEKVR